MAIILNIDTATEVCSVSLSQHGKIIALKESVEEKIHASLLTVYIEQIFKNNLIQNNQLDAVAVSKGPGSYTGLRIGVSVAKGICYGRDIPLIGINTLQIMANGLVDSIYNGKDYPNNVFLCPMIDARRMEVYTAIYNNDLKEILPASALIIDENTFKYYLTKHCVLFFGNGGEKCKSLVNHKNARFIQNYSHSSSHMTSLSEKAYSNSDFENVAYFEPFYLKDFITTTPKAKNL